MNALQFSFYALSAVILVSAVLAMTTRRIFRSAIWLLFSLAGIAGLFFWMQAEFLAAVQLVVYVGGVVVLIIFSVFLTQQVGSEMPRASRLRRSVSAGVALLGFIFIFGLISKLSPGRVLPGPFQLSVSELGSQLLSVSQHGYALPFELVSVLLLAVMVGCIVIAMKGKPFSPEKIDQKKE
jgi:NADH-quinone oxidoreductase subunit J